MQPYRLPTSRRRPVLAGASLLTLAVLAACGGGAGEALLLSDPAQVRAGTPGGSAPVTGAIFTSDAAPVGAGGCAAVNRNLFDAKDHVFLNGGPDRPGAAGLVPWDKYHVKVTSPEGELLGSSGSATPVETNGLGNFIACYQLAAIVRMVPQGATGPGSDPGFRDTPNPGGEYKVWVSARPDFPPDQTKTDNFKVRRTDGVVYPLGGGGVRIVKFYDANGDGNLNPGEPLMVEDALAGTRGWKVSLTDFETGNYRTTIQFDGLGDGTRVAREFRPLESNWVATNAYVDSFTGISPPASNPMILNQLPVAVPVGGGMPTVYFGNACLGAGGGKTLGYWSNQNGKRDFDAYNLDNMGLLVLSRMNLARPDGTAFDPTSYADLRNWLLSGNAVNMAYMLSVQLAAMKLNVATGKVVETSLVHALGSTSANPAGFTEVRFLMEEANEALLLASNTTARTPASYLYRDYQALLKNALDAANNNRNFLQASPAGCPFTFDDTAPIITGVVSAGGGAPGSTLSSGNLTGGGSGSGAVVTTP